MQFLFGSRRTSVTLHATSASLYPLSLLLTALALWIRGWRSARRAVGGVSWETAATEAKGDLSPIRSFDPVHISPHSISLASCLFLSGLRAGGGLCGGSYVPGCGTKAGRCQQQGGPRAQRLLVRASSPCARRGSRCCQEAEHSLSRRTLMLVPPPHAVGPLCLLYL